MKYRLVVTLPVYVALYAATLAASFLLRFDLEAHAEVTRRFFESLPFVLFTKVCFFTVTREWRRRHRYTTMIDIVSIVSTASLSSMTIGTAHAAGLLENSLPRSVIAIDWLLTILFTGLLRTTARFVLEESRYEGSQPDQLRALIFGADSKAIAILRALQSAKSEYKVVALVELSGAGAESLIGGVPVATSKGGITKIAQKFDANHLLIPSGIPGKTVRELRQVCKENGLTAA